PRPRRHGVPINAVIVGLNYYSNDGVRSLQGAVNDAYKFRKGLLRYYQAKKRNIKLFVDAKLKNRKYRCVTCSDVVTAIMDMFRKARRGDILVYYFAGHGGSTSTKQYNNNSGNIEFLRTNKGDIRDGVMRQLSESVPEGCLFYIVTDCCKCGGLVEGVHEQIGTSTKHSVIRVRGEEPRMRYLSSLRKTSDIPNAIHLSACQNFQLSAETFFEDQNQSGGLFTDSLLKVLKKNYFRVSNIDLTRKIRKRMRNMKLKEKQHAGLYCSDVQGEFNFLSFEWMGLSKRRKRKLEKMGQTAIGSLKGMLPHKVIQSLEREDGTWQWDRIVDDFVVKGKMKNCLAVCGGTNDVSVAFGLLVSELSDKPWKGKVINFSAEPDLHVIEGDDLRSKTNFVKDMERGVNIDFQRVFDCILDVAIEENLKEDRMIKRIFVLSDMEFDEASANSWETDYQEITRKYGEAGYAVPQLVFWNLEDSRIGPIPATQNGVVRVGGFSENLLALFLVNEGDITL
ncbi:hypothetical protein L195_g004019, partial [Trifolium pratense]